MDGLHHKRRKLVRIPSAMMTILIPLAHIKLASSQLDELDICPRCQEQRYLSDCPVCTGSGEENECEPCSDCKGTGFIHMCECWSDLLE